MTGLGAANGAAMTPVSRATAIKALVNFTSLMVIDFIKEDEAAEEASGKQTIESDLAGDLYH